MIWKTIPSWDQYEASACGQIRRKGRSRNHAQHPSSKRRLQVCICQDGVQKSPPVHTLVAEAFIGPRPAGMEINHIDGDHTNNSASNLEYVTPEENKSHAVLLGLTASGERNARTNLEEDDIIDIVLAIGSGAFRQKHLAKCFLVDATTITNIKIGKTWAHVTSRLSFADTDTMSIHGNKMRHI